MGEAEVRSIVVGAPESQTRSDLRVSGGCSGQGSAVVPVRPMEFDRWVADLPKYFARTS